MSSTVFGRPARLHPPVWIVSDLYQRSEDRGSSFVTWVADSSSSSDGEEEVQSRRRRRQPVHAGIARARNWQQARYDDHSFGSKYSETQLCQLFETVLRNSKIQAAAVNNLQNLATRTVDRAILRFAARLPKSRLIAVNLGEYTASSSVWEKLLKAIQESQLGHLYISESHMSNLSADQKRRMQRALSTNRRKFGYLRCILKEGMQDAVKRVNPWWAPPQTAKWLYKQRLAYHRLRRA